MPRRNISQSDDAQAKICLARTRRNPFDQRSIGRSPMDCGIVGREKIRLTINVLQKRPRFRDLFLLTVCSRNRNYRMSLAVGG